MEIRLRKLYKHGINLKTNNIMLNDHEYPSSFLCRPYSLGITDDTPSMDIQWNVDDTEWSWVRCNQNNHEYRGIIKKFFYFHNHSSVLCHAHWKFFVLFFINSGTFLLAQIIFVITQGYNYFYGYIWSYIFFFFLDCRYK